MKRGMREMLVVLLDVERDELLTAVENGGPGHESVFLAGLWGWQVLVRGDSELPKDTIRSGHTGTKCPFDPATSEPVAAHDQPGVAIE